MTTQTLPASLPAPAASQRLPSANQHRRLRSLAIAAAVVAAGVVGARLLLAPKAAALHFQTAPVDRGPIAAKVTANGTLSALVTVRVGSQVSGRIQSLRADFGSHVVAGQVVATIEPSLLRAAAAQANANYRAALAGLERARAQELNATRQFERTALLKREGLTTGVEYDTAEAGRGVARAELGVARSNIEQARAARDQAELNLHYTTIVSPIDGIVISRDVDVGQTVAAALQAPTLFTIAQDLTRMQVDTNVAEADVGKIHEGMPVEFTVDTYPGQHFPGKVRQVRDNAQTVQNVVTYDAVVDVENPERLLKPGMTASVVFVYAEKADALRVPNGALRFRPDVATLALLGQAPKTPTLADERNIWILRDGHAAPRSIRIGISDGVTTEVAEGALQPNDAAVLEATAADAKRAP
jgi:HlyD family secretion protein